MFRNIGKKIKVLAKVLCWIGIVFSAIMGILIMVIGPTALETAVPNGSAFGGLAIVSGLLVIIFGALFSWIGSFVLYGYGQLIDNSERIGK